MIMKIRQARAEDTAVVTAIVRRILKEQYPHYYPPGAVQLYLDYHNAENIGADIARGVVYVAEDGDALLGTITVEENHLSRLYVDMDAQGRGIGTALLDFAEARALEAGNVVRLETSLPGKPLYLKRGYVETAYHLMPGPGGDFLAYDDMEKTSNRCRTLEENS